MGTSHEDSELGKRFLDECELIYTVAKQRLDSKTAIAVTKGALSVAITCARDLGMRQSRTVAVRWYDRLTSFDLSSSTEAAKALRWATPALDHMLNDQPTRTVQQDIKVAISLNSGLHMNEVVDPVIETSRRSRNIKYRIRVSGVGAFITLITAAAAIEWPIHGQHIQPAFFLSLASSSLTLLGIAFTLCLIGTQLTATKTNISVRRIFGPIAWFYLTLFVVTTLWTLTISYRAGNAKDPVRLCPGIASAKACMSETLAGRISIFGLVWSLVLLPAFIVYIYRRLSTTYIFSALVGSALRARTELALKNRCEQLSREIVSASSDPPAAAEGLNHLLELGALGAKLRKCGKRIGPDQRAAAVTSQFRDLNRQLANSPMAVPLLRAFETWSTWLVCHAQTGDPIPQDHHGVGTRQVGQLARVAVDCATVNLRAWRESEGTSASARSSIRLTRAIATACRPQPIRMRVSWAATELAECAVRKSVEGSSSDFNMALRGLISLCFISSLPESRNLNGKVVLGQLILVLETLGSINTRNSIPRWVLTELHNLTDGLSLRIDAKTREWQNYINAVGGLEDNEVIGIIAPPSEAKLHRFDGVLHSPWQKMIIGGLEAGGRQALCVRAEDAATRSWAKDGDLNGLVTHFVKLGAEYYENSNDDTNFLLVSGTAYIRHYFQALSRRNRPRPKIDS